jgi:hypothetical protein
MRLPGRIDEVCQAIELCWRWWGRPGRCPAQPAGSAYDVGRGLGGVGGGRGGARGGYVGRYKLSISTNAVGRKCGRCGSGSSPCTLGGVWLGRGGRAGRAEGPGVVPTCHLQVLREAGGGPGGGWAAGDHVDW